MFSRSATAFVVLASVELLVLLLAVGHFGVLLLLAVVAALVAFGTAPVFGRFTVFQRFGQIDHRLPRHLADVSSLFLTPTGPESNPPAAARELR